MLVSSELRVAPCKGESMSVRDGHPTCAYFNPRYYMDEICKNCGKRFGDHDYYGQYCRDDNGVGLLFSTFEPREDSPIMTKDEAAKKLGLKKYDPALKQGWLDDVCLNLRLAAIKDDRIPKDGLYDTILCGTVWCYEDSLFGYPMPLTKKAAELLKIFAELKNQPVPEYDMEVLI